MNAPGVIERSASPGRATRGGPAADGRSTVVIIAEFGAFGGTRSYLLNLLELYGSLGWRVVVALEREQLDDELLGELQARGWEWWFLRSRRIGARTLRDRQPFALLFDLIELVPLVLSIRPRLVVCSVATPGRWLGLMLLPIRLLYVLHTVPTVKSRLGVERRLARRLSARRRLLTVSEFARQGIQRFWTGGAGAGVEMVYNPIGVMPDAEGERGASACGDRPRVLTLGHIREYKNPRGWIEVARRVLRRKEGHETEFVWAGEGELYEECVRAVQSEGDERITFIGRQQDVGELYRTAGIYFQPSLVESHGIAVVDAMAWGLPCVVANTGGLPESVVDGETGFVVDPADLDMMAEKISLLLSDPDLCARMGEAGRRRSSELFGRDTWARKMTSIHQRLMRS